MAERVLYLTEVLILLAAFPLMPWLKREGEREWARHVSRTVTVTIVADFSRFTAAAAAMGSQFAQMGAAAADMERAMRKLRETLQAKPADLQALKDHAARIATHSRPAQGEGTREGDS